METESRPIFHAFSKLGDLLRKSIRFKNCLSPIEPYQTTHQNQKLDFWPKIFS